MTRVIFTHGDIFAGPFQALAHGVNCLGVMGAGIAVEFKRRYPDMYREYSGLCSKKRLQPGDVFTWEHEGVTIYNLATQRRFGDATIEAVESSVRKMVRHAEERGIQMIGLPRIAAGLGGLEWAPVKEALARIGEDCKPLLVVHEEYVPGRAGVKTHDIQIPAITYQLPPESPT